MATKKVSANDQRIFKRTAQSTRAVNIYPTNPRGGVRL